MSKILTALLIIPLLSILALAAIWEPAGAGRTYWLSVVWIMFLVCLIWYTAIGIYGSSRNSGSQGATGTILGAIPAIGITTVLYSAASAWAVIALNVGTVSPAQNITIQILAGMLASMLVALMLLAHKGSLVGSETVVHKDQLLQHLNQLSRLDDIHPATKALVDEARDYVLYKLPPASKVSQKKLLLALHALESLDHQLPAEDTLKNAVSHIRSA